MRLTPSCFAQIVNRRGIIIHSGWWSDWGVLFKDCGFGVEIRLPITLGPLLKVYSLLNVKDFTS